MFKKLVLFITMMSMVILTGCTTPTLYEVAKSNSANVENNVEAKTTKAYPQPPAVMTENKAYVDTTPVSLIATPKWLKRNITLHGNNLPFSFYVSQLTQNSDAVLTYGPSIDKGKLISLDYKGSVQGALNQLAASSNYYYRIDKKNNKLTWSALETKVFDISFLPGDAQYQLGGSTLSNDSSSSSGSSGSSGSSSGGSSSDSSGFSFSQDTQFSSLTGSISVWKDLATSVKALLSKEGKAEVSESTTTITVHDHPQNINAVAEYIEVMNEELSQQVRIHVQVLEVQLTQQFNYGINWNLVKQFTQGSVSISGSMADNANNTGSFSPAGIAFTGATGESWDGTDIILQALQQQGQVSLITEPTLTTMNDQVGTIAIQNQQVYVSGGSTTSNDNSTTSAVTPDTVTTGFDLYLLPKIQKDKVYMQISTILSNLVAMNTFNANTGESGTSTASSNAATGDTTDQSAAQNIAQATTQSQGVNVIQEPATTLRTFNQRAVIPNGATLILAGFMAHGNRSNQSKFANSALLGGKGATSNNVEMVMLITPIILSKDENDMAPVKGYKGQGSVG